jgi:hypothetical protein
MSRKTVRRYGLGMEMDYSLFRAANLEPVHNNFVNPSVHPI